MNKDIKVQDLVNMNDYQAVYKEVVHILGMISKGIDISLFDKAFIDVQALFKGEYPGYQGCNTEYHDFGHTLDATMAMIRLVHGAVLSGLQFSDHSILLAMISTLFHDAGYIQDETDTEGTGAKYTACHVERSVDFIKVYYKKIDLTDLDFQKSATMIRCTGLDVNLSKLVFSSFEVEILGKLLGTADLLGQMADRNYIEKLLFLYHEFKEGNIPGFESEYDLLIKTLIFYDVTQERFAKVLNHYDKLVINHFQERYNITEDLYDKAIQAHVGYIKNIIKEYSGNYRQYLKRGNLVEKLEKKLKSKK